MVIPLPSNVGGNMQGAAPESAEPRMKQIKWSVLVVMAMYVVKIVLLYLGDVFSDLFYIISGIFLLKEDEHTVKIYNLLMSSPIASCAGPTGGGLTCLFPLMLMGGMNILFGFMRLNMLTMVSMGAQIFGVYHAYKVYKIVSSGEGGGDPNGDQRVSSAPSGGGSVRDMREMDTPSGPPNKDAQTTRFVPFTGEGNTLGTV